MEHDIKTLITNMGGSFSGFSNIGEFLPEQLKKYPFAITFGVRLSDAIIDEIDDKPTFTYFNHYRSVNALIDQISLRIVLAIGQQGFKAYSIAASQSIPTAAVPYSGVIPHKTGAVQAGLGWIGKNGLFIHKELGPRLRLGTVLTDMELPCENELLTSKCSTCNRCVNACPAMALSGNEWRLGVQRDYIVDARACSEYMNQKFKSIGRGSVCGICIKVCPQYGHD
jgi:epoxyqueuosine reductase QueG